MGLSRLSYDPAAPARTPSCEGQSAFYFR